MCVVFRLQSSPFARKCNRTIEFHTFHLFSTAAVRARHPPTIFHLSNFEWLLAGVYTDAEENVQRVAEIMGTAAWISALVCQGNALLFHRIEISPIAAIKIGVWSDCSILASFDLAAKGCCCRTMHTHTHTMRVWMKMTMSGRNQTDQDRKKSRQCGSSRQGCMWNVHLSRYLCFFVSTASIFIWDLKKTKLFAHKIVRTRSSMREIVSICVSVSFTCFRFPSRRYFPCEPASLRDLCKSLSLAAICTTCRKIVVDSSVTSDRRSRNRRRKK